MKAYTVWRWISGAPKRRPKMPRGLYIIASSHLSTGWQLRLSAGTGPALVVSHERAPNFIHRALQRLLLGFSWEML